MANRYVIIWPEKLRTVKNKRDRESDGRKAWLFPYNFACFSTALSMPLNTARMELSCPLPKVSEGRHAAGFERAGVRLYTQAIKKYSAMTVVELSARVVMIAILEERLSSNAIASGETSLQNKSIRLICAFISCRRRSLSAVMTTTQSLSTAMVFMMMHIFSMHANRSRAVKRT